jgi:hypothetical protein
VIVLGLVVVVVMRVGILVLTGRAVVRGRRGCRQLRNRG